MGGHALRRDDPAYADAARFGHTVGGRLTVATGGGPGAMEAANLGAYLSRQPTAALDDALARAGGGADVPGLRRRVAGARRGPCARPAPRAARSLGIPTWHYGHEPTNMFATAIAKYFRNALREAILLQICAAGIVFLPGAGGTVQEVFQDACENYYADESSVAPMVLVGRDVLDRDGARHGRCSRPWPRGRPMEEYVHLVDTVEEATSLLLADNPPSST